MGTLTKDDLLMILESLNFLLKNQQNALDASRAIVPIAEKIQSLINAESE